LITPFLVIAILCAAVAVALFILSHRIQRSAGMPTGRVVYSDPNLWGKVEQPLYDPQLSLTGRPDYLVTQSGKMIPVEVKSGWAPNSPREGHVFQLAAYCLLVERTWHQRPSHGLLHYRNRTFAIDYTRELENRLLDLIVNIRRQEQAGEAERSHTEPARCAKCGYRDSCDQRL
jgi:CRISPR-associated exonuclease Cas4